jgi:hypothetical protein
MTEKKADGLGCREWLIAIATSIIIIVLCIGMAIALYGWITWSGDGEAQQLPIGVSEESAEEPSENQQNANKNEDEEPSLTLNLRDSYLLTNPLESIGCLGGIMLILAAIIGWDYYQRRKSRTRK